MTVPDFRPAAFVAAAAAVLSLAACGGSSAAGSPTTGGASSAGHSPATGTAAPAAAGSAHPIDVCMTVPAASAAQLSGQPITTADTITGQPGVYGCAYGNDDDSLQVEVQVFEQNNAAPSYDVFLSGSKNATTVNGLGDKAFFDNDGTMYVLAGSALIQVNGLNTADECAALARPIVAAL